MSGIFFSVIFIKLSDIFLTVNCISFIQVDDQHSFEVRNSLVNMSDMFVIFGCTDKLDQFGKSGLSIID